MALPVLFPSKIGEDDDHLDSDCEADSDYNADGGALLAAADLSNGLFARMCGRPLDHIDGFDKLRVLSVAGTSMEPSDLALVLSGCTTLRKLDVSRCSLTSLPEKDLWAAMKYLKVLLLHKNKLRQWEDMERAVAPPDLRWITAYENPIADQAFFRRYVLLCQPKLLAVDCTLITDSERIGRPDFHCRVRRFVAGRTVVKENPVTQQHTLGTPESQAQALLREHRREMRVLRHQANWCSAACSIQTVWRGYLSRTRVMIHIALLQRVVIMIQRRMRNFLWRRRMTLYVKDYLAEVDELELLISATEMRRRRAIKLIEASVHEWLEKRAKMKKLRDSAELISRTVRGIARRQKLLAERMDLNKDRKIYFPERFAWEFHVLLNMAHRKRGLPPLPVDHEFPGADVIAVRLPEGEDLKWSHSTLLTLLRSSRLFIVRPKRSQRYPRHAWDGPMHRLVNTTAPPGIQRSYRILKRRAAAFNSPCRKAFLASCTPGPHPIDVDVAEDEVKMCFELQELLDGSESAYPEALREPGSILAEFMEEAKRLGARSWRKQRRSPGVYVDPVTGGRVYNKAFWLSQRMLMHTCETQQIAMDMFPLLLRFSKAATESQLFKAIPFLPGKYARQGAAAACIQAAWRAHRARCELKCGLLTAAVLRRAAICIQRGWRWGLVKRRLAMLAGAAAYVRSVRSNCIYIEERLFCALNLIGGIDRYPPMLQERNLGFGYSSEEEDIVLVRGEAGLMPNFRVRRCSQSRPSVVSSRPGSSMSATDGRPGSSVSASMARKRAKSIMPRPTTAQRDRAEGGRRDGGLPSWFLGHVGDWNMVPPEAEELQRISGVQGLLTEGALSDGNDTVSVSIPSLKQKAREGGLGMRRRSGGDWDEDGEPSPALLASGGDFKYMELRFRTLEQARKRALMLFLCTFNTQHKMAVPLLQKSQLQDSSICKRILHLWDVYCLAWPEGDRGVAYKLRQQTGRSVGVVPFCGNQMLYSADKPAEWAVEGNEDLFQQNRVMSRKQAQEEALLSKYSRLSDMLASRRERAEDWLQSTLRGLGPADTLRSMLEEGDLQVVKVVGALPPTTDSRTTDIAEQVQVQRSEQDHMRAQIEEGREADLLEKRMNCIHMASWRSQKKAGSEFEGRLMQFYSDCEEQKRERNRANTLAARAAQGDPHAPLQKPALLPTAPHKIQTKKAALAGAAAKAQKEEARSHAAEQHKAEVGERLEVQARAREQELEQRRELIREEKHARATRRAMKEAVVQYRSRAGQVERATKHHDFAQVKAQRRDEAISTVAETQLKSANRRQVYLYIQQDRQQQVQREVADLRDQLIDLRDLRQQREEDVLRERKEAIEHAKEASRFIANARDQMNSFLPLAQDSLVDYGFREPLLGGPASSSGALPPDSLPPMSARAGCGGAPVASWHPAMAAKSAPVDLAGGCAAASAAGSSKDGPTAQPAPQPGGSPRSTRRSIIAGEWQKKLLERMPHTAR